jgi:hypothetical protein
MLLADSSNGPELPIVRLREHGLTIHETILEATIARGHREGATQTDAPDLVDVAAVLDAGWGTPRRASPCGSSRRYCRRRRHETL